MEPMTYRVGTSWMSGRGTTQVKLDRAGYLSATPVYGQVKNTNGRTARKTPFKNEIIGYDASIMTRVEYEQAPAPAVAQAAPAAPAAPKEVPGKGANRGAVGSLGTSSSPGVAGSAQAGLVGSVNTEVQNDDNLLPYQKV
jgi:hypothetical protein